MRALVCELSVPRQVVTSLLGRIDRRFFFGPFSPATLRELPEPELPAPDWVTIRTRLCGICGSDYKQMFLNGSMDNPMPAGVSDEQAVLADPFSVSLHAILKRPPAPGATALVYGCGTLGLLAIAILRALYPATRVLAVARFAHQRALAERFGAAVVLPHAPARDIVERVAAETGAQIMTPWYG